MIPLALLVSLMALLVSSAKADTAVTIFPVPEKIFAGAGVTNVYAGYTNKLVTFTLTGDTNDVDLYVAGAPAGVTAGLNLDPRSSSINQLVTTTNTVNLYLTLAVTNASAGVYPLSVIASNRFNGLTVSVGTTLILSKVFIATVGSADTNWSTSANWSTGGAPANGDNVRFELLNSAGGQSNAYVDISRTFDSLSFTPKLLILNETNVTYTNTIYTNYFAPNVNMAVSGSNGFWAGVDGFVGTQEKGMTLAFSGVSSALLVTNANASFALWDLAGSGGTKSTFNFQALANLVVDVKRFGGGDCSLMAPNIGVGTGNGGTSLPGGAGQVVDIFFARTNVVRATYAGDYGGVATMTNSIMFFNNAGVNNGSASTANLGISNIFYADSISVASQTAGASGNTLKFNAAFTASNPVAIFRSPSGSRMSFFGVAIDSGTVATTPRTRGAVDFTGGKVDMLVDNMWLGHNRTNFSGGNQQVGNLTFTIGTIDVNTLRAGYKQFTNANLVQSTITVGGTASNATLVVNSLLELGHADLPALETTFTPTGFGKLVVNTNGVVKVNTITAGAATTANSVTINGGGTLILTNTMATAAVPLPLLSVQNFGHLVLNVTAGVTNCFVTNLTDAVGAKIDIASLTGFSPTVPATNVLISYITAGTHNISIGTYPAGYNNISLVDNTSAKTIELRVQTNAPAVLRWKGYVNNVWDHATANWENTNTLAHVAFIDADLVIFEDVAGVPKSISVTDAVIPNSSGTGIYMTNSTSAFSFEDGTGLIGTCSMVKVGTADFTNNAVGSENVTINAGTLRGSGALGGATIASGGRLDYAGTISGSLSISGAGVFNTGAIANGPVTLQGSGVLTNLGTIQGGALTVNGTALLLNQVGGTLKSIGSSGSVNVATNATLINYGDIGVDPVFFTSQANTLTVDGTFKDMGVGNIFLTTATMDSGSRFLPGGDGIGTTQIRSAGTGSSFPGRLTMLAGSTNIVRVDFANAQTNTQIVALYTDFGGNTSVKSFDGCTVVMTNINPGAGVFANGQSFRVFTGPGGGDIGNEGLNTTNRYPIMVPVIPAVNTKWDLTNLRLTSPNGILNIVGFPTTGTNLTFSTYKDGGNIVTHLQWPSEYIGWSLQQQTNSLSVGLYTNWTLVSGSTTNNDFYITNDAAIPASFFRMTYP